MKWLNLIAASVVILYFIMATLLTLGTKFGGERTWLQAIWSGVRWPWVLFKK